jgi:hypothetical protein
VSSAGCQKVSRPTKRSLTKDGGRSPAAGRLLSATGYEAQLAAFDPEETFSVSSSLLQGGHPGPVSMTAMYRPMSVSPASQARDNGDQTQQSAEERRISLRHNPRRALCRFAATTAHGTVMNQQKNIPTRTAASSPPPNIGASAMASACATNETTISPATPLRNEM